MLKTKEEISREEMIDRTIRILNGAIGRITSMHGNPIGYLRNKIVELENLKSRLKERKC